LRKDEKEHHIIWKEERGNMGCKGQRVERVSTARTPVACMTHGRNRNVT